MWEEKGIDDFLNSYTADELEPNDNIGNASFIGPYMDYHLTLAPQGDVDWFQIDPSLQNYNIYFLADDSAGGLMSADMVFTDPFGIEVWYRRISVPSDYEQNEDVEINQILSNPSITYMQILDRYQNNGLLKYHFIINDDFKVDSFEPNEYAGEAALLNSEGTFELSIAPDVTDKDFFEIDPSIDGKYLNINFEKQSNNGLMNEYNTTIFVNFKNSVEFDIANYQLTLSRDPQNIVSNYTINTANVKYIEIYILQSSWIENYVNYSLVIKP